MTIGGDRLPYRAGDRTLILNENPLAEPYLPPETPPSAAAFDILVPEGQVVALSDNRVEPHERDFPEGGPGAFDAADIRGRAGPKPNWLLVVAGAIALGAPLTLISGRLGLSALFARRRARPAPAQPAFIAFKLD
ncbi:hypothetical protein ACFWSF_15085 [Streptomyces sp. NPDC058611]|uniref:hypothetical protein n=1 Tax=unclassified Streptomyces TaxID=2593676 RepID=UPI0036590F6A